MLCLACLLLEAADNAYTQLISHTLGGVKDHIADHAYTQSSSLTQGATHHYATIPC